MEINPIWELYKHTYHAVPGNRDLERPDAIRYIRDQHLPLLDKDEELDACIQPHMYKKQIQSKLYTLYLKREVDTLKGITDNDIAVALLNTIMWHWELLEYDDFCDQFARECRDMLYVKLDAFNIQHPLHCTHRNPL